ncbi:MAG: ABC transporter substrate-binding protein, partial [Lachnospiraceae bacterium]|nr:ABC transporter substrate-binding protein [Lachnospiraceae bacterium]
GIYGPMLAESWDTDDYQTYIFHLRDDVKFHNGDPLTAQDVVYSVTEAQSLPGSQSYDTWRNVVSVEALDDYTVKFVLDDVNVDFLFFASQPYASIVNQRSREEDPEKGSWIGSGPYFVESFMSGDTATFVRNEDYWGTPGVTRKLIFKNIPEMASRTIMMKNGEAQLALSLPSNDLPQFIDNPDYQVIEYRNPNAVSMLFNMTDSICGDLNFRKAVLYALNPLELGMVTFGPATEPSTNLNCYSPAAEFFDPDIPMPAQDLEKAKEYLAASSYNGETIKLSVSVPPLVPTCELIKEELAAIGINIEVNQLDNAGFNAMATYYDNKMQMGLTFNGTTMSATHVRQRFYPESANNRISYNNPEVTELIDKATTISDVDERRAAYYRIQEITAEEIPTFPIFYMINTCVTLPGVGGLQLAGNNVNNFKTTYLELD